MDYAVFDWDYTVREYYTLFKWIDYLCEQHVISQQIQLTLTAMQNRYDLGEITHDEYAVLSDAEYTKAIKGLSQKKLRDYLTDYQKIDERYFFPFTYDLFEMMADYDIAPIVISGAPLTILQQYKDRFHLHSIYAFEAETTNGYYTGKVKRNCGFNKEIIVQALIEKYDGPPLLGFGDSASDLPLLKAARHAVCIGAQGSLAEVPEILYLSPDMPSADILRKVSNIIYNH